MEYINTVLGLAVLSGPLWLIALMVPVSLVVAFIVAKKFRGTGARIGVGVSVVFAFFLALFGDEIAGRMYLNHLCETEAGVKVYQTVELPAEYWDLDGKPKFIDSRGILLKEIIGDRFKWINIEESCISNIVTINKVRWLLKDSLTSKTIGEKITYSRHSGWLNKFSPAPNVGESCRNIWADKHGQQELFRKEKTEEKDFILKIFVPT